MNWRTLNIILTALQSTVVIHAIYEALLFKILTVITLATVYNGNHSIPKADETLFKKLYFSIFNIHIHPPCNT